MRLRLVKLAMAPNTDGDNAPIAASRFLHSWGFRTLNAIRLGVDRFNSGFDNELCRESYPDKTPCFVEMDHDLLGDVAPQSSEFTLFKGGDAEAGGERLCSGRIELNGGKGHATAGINSYAATDSEGRTFTFELYSERKPAGLVSEGVIVSA